MVRSFPITMAKPSPGGKSPAASAHDIWIGSSTQDRVRPPALRRRCHPLRMTRERRTAASDGRAGASPPCNATRPPSWGSQRAAMN
jgi:hypothetical protein